MFQQLHCSPEMKLIVLQYPFKKFSKLTHLTKVDKYTSVSGEAGKTTSTLMKDVVSIKFSDNLIHELIFKT